MSDTADTANTPESLAQSETAAERSPSQVEVGDAGRNVVRPSPPMEYTPSGKRRLPRWFRRPLGSGKDYRNVARLVGDLALNTVCESARCPNRGECWSAGTATVMILGNVCTRNCRYCSVPKGKPLPLDWDEPERVGLAVRDMNLRHAVITSVDRDDVPDGGARIWAETIRAIRRHSPGTAVEVLIPDFKNSDPGSLDLVMEARPDILAHNVETVQRIYPLARPAGSYEAAMATLRRARELQPDVPTKTGIMLGLGEKEAEVKAVLADLRDADVGIVTLGQYLAPEMNGYYLPIDRFVTPEEFDAWGAYGRDLGFRHVESGPLVRSSYHAEKQADGHRPAESAAD